MVTVPQKVNLDHIGRAHGCPPWWSHMLQLYFTALRSPWKFGQTLQAGATNFCKVEVNFHFTVILAPVRSVEVYSVKFSCTLQFTITVP